MLIRGIVKVVHTIPDNMTERKQRNKLRFFYPIEWGQFSQCVMMNPRHEFWTKWLLNTGQRYGEARATLVKHIDFERKFIEVHRTKNKEPKIIFLSTSFTNEILRYKIQNKLGQNDNFGFPSNQYMDKMIKQYARKANLRNPEDFGCHTFRKTCENWLCGLGVNSMILTKMIGHSIKVADSFYVAQAILSHEDKWKIRSFFGDLTLLNQGDTSTTSINRPSSSIQQFQDSGSNYNPNKP